MKAIQTAVNATVLVLMIIGTTFVGACLGEMFLGAHGGKFFDLKQQCLIAGMLLGIGTLLSVCAHWPLTELLAGLLLAQIVVIVIIGYTCGWDSFDWLWRLSRFTTLPFAVSIGIGCAMTKHKVTHKDNG